MMNTHRRMLLSSLEASKIVAANLHRNRTRQDPSQCKRNRNHGFGSWKVFQYQATLPKFAFSLGISYFRCFATDSEYSFPPEVQSLYSMISSISDGPDPSKSPSKPFSAETVGNIKLLYDLGMTNEEIVKCETTRPGFIRSSFIKSHVDFLQDNSLTAAEICNIMQRVPQFFTTPPPVIQDIAEYFLDVGLTKKYLKDLIIFSPSIFYRVKGRPQKIGSFIQGILREHHPEVDHSATLAHMLRDDIKLFNRTENELRKNLQFLLQMGFKGPNLVKVIRYCPSALRIGTDFLQQRWDYLQWKLEMDHERTIKAIVRLPRILTIAEDKLTDKFAFLYDRAKFKPQDILGNLKVFERSVEHLEKRFDILNEVKYQGNFITMLVAPPDTFYERTENLRAQSLQDLKDHE